MKTSLAIVALMAGLLTGLSAQASSYDSHFGGNCSLVLRNLTNCDFSYSDLAWKDLDDRNFFMADFKGAELEGTLFSGSSLVRANFRDANLYAAKFYQSDLREADLRGARLNGSWLVGADLSTVKIDENTTFNGSAYSRKTTKLPKAFGDFPHVEAAKRGMLPIRE